MITITDKIERLIAHDEPTHCFAYADHRGVIDTINPETGRSLYGGLTLEEIRTKYPDAIQCTLDEHCAAKAAKQDTPISYTETTYDRWSEMLEVLPPAAMDDGCFLVGEPWDHHAQSGKPRFEAYMSHSGRYWVSTRPMTRAEFAAEVKCWASVLGKATA